MVDAIQMSQDSTIFECPYAETDFQKVFDDLQLNIEIILMSCRQR
jgi:hypothetical protein